MSVDVALHHDFGGFFLDAQFRVEHKGVTALFGPSGAGKTSIVNAIAGLLKPREGRIAIDGRVVLDTKANIFVPAYARRIGYVFQDARLFPHMNVENNLRFGWRRAPVRCSGEEFAHIVNLLGLEKLLSRQPAKLSGGEKGRVALGRALLASPELLLLDEPLVALDAARKAEILPYLERLRDEARVPMLYVSHSLDEVTRLADHVVLVRQGRVAAQGSVFDLLSDLDFSDRSGAPPYGTVLDAKISAHRDDGLTVLAFPGGELMVGRLARPPGSRLRVRIRAEDVMLACEEPRAISANNVLAATITGLRDGPQTDVQLDCGGAKLVARITRSSAARLGLAPGMRVFAIVKSVTVDPQIGKEI
ncbi:MAG TPA: molybdenum ABC transporter ATP-binding protein [Rhizomicrobium sp.]|nr:molybdenum ABC transporter ATP-binding protein [Rhizomicrobium sp.]